MAIANDFRELTDDELAKREKDLKEELFNIRIQVSTQQINNYARIKQIRRDIARLETVKQEKKVNPGDIDA
ncbi:MAG: 50S ribosomal protein L29 [Thermodesulfobacteriota bacterium]